MTENGHVVLKTKWLEDRLDYDGLQLRSHFIREAAGIFDDGVVAFAGSCDVEADSLVDLEDAMAGSTIKAAMMLHFIGEHFGCPLRESNFRLRLFASIVKDVIESAGAEEEVRRDGDDLFLGERKLSVAISTVTPVSSVFHFGVNIDPAGAPVPAVGLKELGLEAPSTAGSVLERYHDECGQIELALRKVKGRF